MPALLERLKTALADRYAVESEIGRGGMAVVFLAQDLKHGRRVAIKVLHPELGAAVGADRFLREIETVAGLNHPHVLPLHDSGEADGLLFYVMPYVDGESLGQRLSREGQLPLDEALRIAREVADGLDYAHEQGVVHRDIKPGNILLSRGHASIADFGIAKAIGAAGGGDSAATATGLSVGTPRYMSPEQAAGAVEVDGRSDVYALGCVLWEMLAGEPPFDGPTPRAILARKSTEEPPEVRVVRKAVPAALENVLAKAMAASAADRIQSAGELAKALEAPETVGRVRRRKPRARQLVIGVVALAAVVAGTWLAATRTGSEPDATAVPFDSAAIAVLPFQVIGADSTSPVRELAQSMGDLFELKVTGDFERRIAHPATVAAEWRRAGGSPDTALSEAAELGLGRALGVGALVRGTVVEGDSGIVLAARMVDVATGAIRVPTVRAEGPLGTWEGLHDLVDQLIVLLLTRDWGYSATTAPRLAQYEPEAIQAYLAGHRAPFQSPEKDRYYRAALAADSNLVDAALWLYATGESQEDSAELRYAWEHQDQLTERGRAYLQVLAAGKHGSITTRAGVIAGYEAVAQRWPEWSVPWTELGEKLTTSGAITSSPDWHRRAWEALIRIERPSSNGLWHLNELAFMEGDTVRAREQADRILARTTGTNDWLAGVAQSYQWRLAILRGDTAAATRALAQTEDSSWVTAFSIADGRGIADADRVVAAGIADLEYTWVDNWLWARGRDPEWREAWRRSAIPPRPVSRAAVTVYRALLLGPKEDTVAAEAIQRLARIASGRDSPAPSESEQILARCWITLWQLVRGDTTDARGTLQLLTDHNPPYRYAGWAGLIEVLLKRLEGGEVRAPLLRTDSIVAEAPLGQQRGDISIEVQNLMLARLLREYGELERAVAAARRRVYEAPFVLGQTSFVEYLREEARLAATLGDTSGAIEAYRHYFALRDTRPAHPTWAAFWDSMRVEYGVLTGVEIQ